jgi:transposase
MPYMTAYNNELDVHDVTFVMDGGFCAAANMRYLHSENMKYLIAVDMHLKTKLEAINQVKDDIASPGKLIIDKTYGKTITSRFFGVKSNMHIYYNADIAEQQRHDLLRKAIYIGDTLEQFQKLATKQIKRYSRFYDIKPNKDGTFKHSLNYDKVDFEAQYCGYFCIPSNTEANKSEILSLYGKKDVIEKGFDDVKNHIDMKRIHTHSEETTTGKLFCAFIASIAVSQMAGPVRDIDSVGGEWTLMQAKAD